jgi:hypothetical protein
MISVLELGATPSAAFLRGLAKGLAAPFLLYGNFTSAVTLPTVQTVEPVRMRPQARNEWETVGADLRAVLLRYEQAE